jgi:HK97 family phage major capsid protein
VNISGTNEWRGVTSAGVTASYATEAAPASDNSPTLAQPPFITKRAQCFVPVSIELTQDWGSLQTELGSLIQDAKDDLEATKFTTGTGTNEPKGILVAATSTVSAGSGLSISINDIYNAEVALPPRFRARAQWIANRFIFNKIRQFDTAGGASLWVPNFQMGIQNNVPDGGNTGFNLIGYPANEASAFPAATSPTLTKMMLIGDLRYYVIVERVGMDIELIPHIFDTATGFPKGQRGIYAFWRNHADAIDVNAFRILTSLT